MPSSVCSFARFVSLSLPLTLPFSLSLSLSVFLSFFLYLALVHIYIHNDEPAATVAVCAHHQLSCNQPASQPARAATAANQQRRRSFVVMRNRSRNGGSSHRLLPRRHRETNSYRGADPHRRDPRRSCPPFSPCRCTTEA